MGGLKFCFFPFEVRYPKRTLIKHPNDWHEICRNVYVPGRHRASSVPWGVTLSLTRFDGKRSSAKGNSRTFVLDSERVRLFPHTTSTLILKLTTRDPFFPADQSQRMPLKLVKHKLRKNHLPKRGASLLVLEKK